MSFSRSANRTGGTSSRSVASAALELLPLLLGEAVELDRREHLADLHRRAAHLPELFDELLDQRRGPLPLGRGGPLRRPDSVGGPHPGPPQALTRHAAHRHARCERADRLAACPPPPVDRRPANSLPEPSGRPTADETRARASGQPWPLSGRALAAAGFEVLHVPAWRTHRERRRQGPGKTDPGDAFAIADVVRRKREKLGPALQPELVPAISILELAAPPFRVGPHAGHPAAALGLDADPSDRRGQGRSLRSPDRAAQAQAPVTRRRPERTDRRRNDPRRASWGQRADGLDARRGVCGRRTHARPRSVGASAQPQCTFTLAVIVAAEPTTSACTSPRTPGSTRTRCRTAPRSGATRSPGSPRAARPPCPAAACTSVAPTGAAWSTAGTSRWTRRPAGAAG